MANKIRDIWRRRSASVQYDSVHSLLGSLPSSGSPPGAEDSLSKGCRTPRRRSISTGTSHEEATAAILVEDEFVPIDSRRDSVALSERSLSQNSVDRDSNPDEELDPLANGQMRLFLVDDPNLGYARLLKAHSCYYAIPGTSQIVVLDTSLKVKKAFYALIYNSCRAALIWDGMEKKMIGVLSITDFIQVLLRYRDQARRVGKKENLAENFQEQKIGTWRTMLETAGLGRPLVTITSHESLFRATQMLTEGKYHRLPIVDPETRNPLYILTYKRILHFMWIFGKKLPRPLFMEQTPHRLGLGVWGEQVVTISPDCPLEQCLQLLLERKVSGLPVVKEGRVVDMYTRFDAIGIAAQGRFDDLDVTVAEALKHRRESPDFEGLVKCSEWDTLVTVVDLLVNNGVHRVVVTDGEDRLQGLVAISDVIRYMVLQVSGISTTGTELTEQHHLSVDKKVSNGNMEPISEEMDLELGSPPIPPQQITPPDPPPPLLHMKPRERMKNPVKTPLSVTIPI